ncbi:MBL fold metallo-hydrolase RNA specificity domain-containing protein [candidate division KSB1 bacterium]
MYVTFFGATREVTGSMHLITTGTDRIMLDCGLYQGKRKESDEKNRTLPFDPGIITNVVLSHAHIDHSGRIPVLTKGSFNGRIFCTRATAGACSYLLADSAHIQESDADYLNYKSVRAFLYQLKSPDNSKKITKREMNEIKRLLKKDKHELNSDSINETIEKYNLQSVRPLYTKKDAEYALGLFDGYPYNHPVIVGKEITCTFFDAGHILGSAFSLIKKRSNGHEKTIFYTGDIGRFEKPIINDPTLDFPESDRDIDLLIMESTYGNRLHGPVKDLKPQLKKVIIDTVDRGGSIIIPSFAFGRTQELVYVLHELYDNKEAPRLPVYVDSPLAINLTKVFGEHPEVYDEETHEVFLNAGKNPFLFSQVNFVNSVAESMQLMKETNPHIVIASSGMCEAGRILHHMRYKIHNPKNTVLIVGYMGANTLGRRLLESGREYEESGRKGHAPLLKLLNKVYPLNAHVVELGGFSAHADRNELIRFLSDSNLRIKKIALVHGEEDQSHSFGEYLKKEGYPVVIPRAGESIFIE